MMFTDYTEQFQREGLQQGSTQVLRLLPPESKKDKKKDKKKDAERRLGFAIPTRGRRRGP